MLKQLIIQKGIESIPMSKYWLMAGLVILLMCGCSPRMIMPVTNSAHVPAAAKLKSVAVYPIEGRYGNVYRAEIESLLVSAELKGRHYFSVVERAKLDNVLNEQRLGPMFDAATVVRVGKLIGAQGVFMGDVTADTVSDNSYRVHRKRCASSDKDGKCQRWRDVSIACTRRIANVAFTIRLVDVETGVQSYNRDVTGQATSQACRDGGSSLQHRDTVRKRARQVAYGEIRKDIAPYTVNLSIELMDDTDGIKSSQAKRDLESGIAFAEEDRLDRACEFWQEAFSRASQSVAIRYNLGVCAEAAGDFESANALYQEADRLLEKPEPIINSALKRVKKRLK